jgi:hypothetical protein
MTEECNLIPFTDLNLIPYVKMHACIICSWLHFSIGDILKYIVVLIV